ncbi:hypothetical protein ABEF93_004104 [Exophiala dermatitidis]
MLDSFTIPMGPTPALPSTTSQTGRISSLTPAFPRNPATSLVSKHWHNRYLSWQNRDVLQRRDAVKNESERIKLFGGEPGDDVGLCYKMMEVFEGMNWIDNFD